MMLQEGSIFFFEGKKGAYNFTKKRFMYVINNYVAVTPKRGGAVTAAPPFPPTVDKT
jgi:hypothetical protein